MTHHDVETADPVGSLTRMMRMDQASHVSIHPSGARSSSDGGFFGKVAKSGESADFTVFSAPWR
ncbi:MAG: hypothetical protein H0W83_07645 [Planctomycetes bacterium]|nr:hypothetical protein [Planctomycetota bacterium]